MSKNATWFAWSQAVNASPVFGCRFCRSASNGSSVTAPISPSAFVPSPIHSLAFGYGEFVLRSLDAVRAGLVNGLISDNVFARQSGRSEVFLLQGSDAPV